MTTTTTRGLRVPLADGTDVGAIHTHLVNLGTDLDTQFITVANFAALPAASKLGRRAVALDTNVAYLDNGTAWIQQGVPLVTVLPTGQVSGFVVDLQTSAMATDKIVWRMRHVGSNKFIFVGGGLWWKAPVLPNFVSISSQSNANQDIANPIFTSMPAGVYHAWADGFLDSNDAAEDVRLYVKGGTTYNLINRSTRPGGGIAGAAAAPYHSIYGERDIAAITVGQSIQLALQKSGTNLFKSLRNFSLAIKPVYLQA